MASEQADEADRGRHTGFARHEGLAGGPGSLSLSFAGFVHRGAMWKELIDRLGNGCEFLPSTNLDAIREAEVKLSITFPADLRDLLLEANGVWGPGGNGLIWTVD